jgi:hypothetical protein
MGCKKRLKTGSLADRVPAANPENQHSCSPNQHSSDLKSNKTGPFHLMIA